MPSIISSLTPNEQEALAICGIQKDEQLAKIDPDTLLRDLQVAKETFPEAAFDISEDKLRSICNNALQAEDGAPSPAPEERTPVKESSNDVSTDEEAGEQVERFRILPELSLRSHQHHTAKHTTTALWEAPGVAHSVHCAHPIATYLSALSVVGLHAGVFSLLLLPFILFAGYLDKAYLYPCAAAGLALLLPYLFIGIRCYCSVCKMRFFRLVPYNTNRHAHTIPFFGLTAFVTALHIAFLFWYRCPACGTAIRLFHTKRRHHSH